MGKWIIDSREPSRIGTIDNGRSWSILVRPQMAEAVMNLLNDIRAIEITPLAHGEAWKLSDEVAKLFAEGYRKPIADSAECSDGGLGGAQPPNDNTESSRTFGMVFRMMATARIKQADAALLSECADLILSVDRTKARAFAFLIAERLDPRGK
tara:strand:- start:2506 stop:2964 length:459 start_codon:yes stop_codon:yes gene_type:complete